ncbi:zinc finger protein 775-like [Monomorium pharaonis]|uniref:zinc finger protein 775-like n=1 Tax=Monomorium pharaonis TaxID=307658 RepID=UPI001746598B|nr:zinc finger protein 775-like [Monomorium pharaonis]
MDYLFVSYGIGPYDSTKPDASQNINPLAPPTRRRRGSGRRSHVCPKCGNGYTVIKSLRRHLRYECGLTPRFRCPYCGTRSKQRAHLLGTVSGRTPPWFADAQAEQVNGDLCASLNFSQGQVTGLIRDVKIKLEASLESSLQSICSVVMEESQNPFSYEDSKPLNSTRRRRGEHVEGDIERHTCSRCSKSYIHAWHLKRHTKFECGQEPRVQCPYCSAKMKQRGHVYRHIRQCHRGQNVYVIDLN